MRIHIVLFIVERHASIATEQPSGLHAAQHEHVSTRHPLMSFHFLISVERVRRKEADGGILVFFATLPCRI